MDELSRKFRSIDWKGLQKQARKVQASTASALKDMVMTDLENKTRAATADTSWGASGADLMAIAHGTYRREDYTLIMSIVWQRLSSSRRRCVYKALELLKFLIMHGASRCADEARAALPHLRHLTEYIATDEHGRDVGDGVRKRAVVVCQMLSDEAVLEEERMKSRELRSKLQGGADAPGGRLGGVSSDDYRFSGHRNNNSEFSNSAGSGNSGFGGTQTFKGYGDDDAEDNYQHNYDDAPQGQFAQRAKDAAQVDDLLGGDDDTQAQHNGNSSQQQHPSQGVADDDDDDESFDPRGAVVPASAISGTDDLLADLENLAVTTPASAANGSSAGTSNVPTSQLVLQLAAQQSEQNGMQLAVVKKDDEESSAAHAQSPAQTQAQAQTATAGESDDLFFGGGDESEAAKSAGGMTTGSNHMKEGEKRILTNVTEKEKDPFADLISGMM